MPDLARADHRDRRTPAIREDAQQQRALDLEAFRVSRPVRRRQPLLRRRDGPQAASVHRPAAQDASRLKALDHGVHLPLLADTQVREPLARLLVELQECDQNGPLDRVQVQRGRDLDELHPRVLSV